MLDLPGNWGFNIENSTGFRVREIGLGVDMKISALLKE